MKNARNAANALITALYLRFRRHDNGEGTGEGVMKAVIIGAGLGGLLAGAKLTKAGHDVEIFERLPFTGGRFTNLPYQGFKLRTVLAYSLKFKPKNDISFRDWVLKYFDDEFLFKLADSFCGWALSLQARDVTA